MSRARGWVLWPCGRGDVAVARREDGIAGGEAVRPLEGPHSLAALELLSRAQGGRAAARRADDALLAVHHEAAQGLDWLHVPVHIDCVGTRKGPCNFMNGGSAIFFNAKRFPQRRRVPRSRLKSSRTPPRPRKWPKFRTSRWATAHHPHALPTSSQTRLKKTRTMGNLRARAFQKRKKCLNSPQAHARLPCLKALLICTLTSLISVISPPRDQPAPIPPPRSTVTRLEDK